MFLTLEIVAGPNTAALPTRSHTFGIEGGRIGRAADNDWSIPYEFMHGRHATVRFFNGLFYIEKLGSNTVAVGSPAQDLKTGDSFPLIDGSRLFLDEFELSVKVAAERAPVPRTAMQPPPEFDAHLTQTGVHAPIPGLGGPLPMASGDADRRLDDFLRDPSPPPVAPMGRSQQVDHLDGVYDHMSIPTGTRGMPPPPPPPPPSSASMFGEGWDKTNYAAPRAAPPPPPPPPPRAPDPGYGAARERTGPGWAPPPPPPQPQYAPPPPDPRQAYGRGAMPPGGGYERTTPPMPPPMAIPPSPAYERAPPPPPQAAAYRAPAAPGMPVPREIGALLASFGVDPAALAPGDLETLGRALRNAVTGTIATLQARSEMRARFRLAGTQMAHGDPNPLKVAPNLDDALHEFFRRRLPGTLPLDAAIAAALEEVQAHQLALLDAMEGAFRSLLDRFDPATVEDIVERTGRRGALSSKAAHLWEGYVALFGQMTADRDEAYRKYFGAEFARAYDQALERRRTSSRNNKRQG